MGMWGRDWAWRVVPEIKEVQAVGYVDPEQSSLDDLSQELPGAEDRCFRSLEQAIIATRPQALLITTPLQFHASAVARAIEAGLHVLVEKPFARDVSTAGELVAAAERKGVVLMVSQNYRFFPAVRKVAHLLSEGSLGDLYEVSIDFRRYSAATATHRARHHDDEQPLLVDMSIHHFDLLRMLLGREPDRISCETRSPRWTSFAGPTVAVAAISFGDVLVGYRGSWVSAGPITPWAGEWRMEFERGAIDWTSRGDNGALADRVVVRRHGAGARTQRLSPMAIDRWGTLTEFAAAIRDGREPQCSGRDNLGTIAFMSAAVESAERGTAVSMREDYARC